MTEYEKRQLGLQLLARQFENAAKHAPKSKDTEQMFNRIRNGHDTGRKKPQISLQNEGRKLRSAPARILGQSTARISPTQDE